MLKHINPSAITKEVAIDSIKNNPINYQYVPYDIIDKSISDLVYGKIPNDIFIKHTPFEIMSYYYERLICDDWRLYYRIPQMTMSDSTVMKLLSKMPYIKLPKRYDTDKINTYRISVDPYVIEYLDGDDITLEMAITVLRKDPLLLKFIPIKLKSRELCELAFYKNALSIAYIPIDYINDDIVLSAVKRNGLTISMIPAEYITQEIANIAVRTTPYSIIYVPKRLVTPMMAHIAIRDCMDIVEHLPINIFDNTELCEYIIWTNAMNISVIPKSKRTKHICDMAFTQNIDSAEYFPKLTTSQRKILEKYGKHDILNKFKT